MPMITRTARIPSDSTVSAAFDWISLCLSGFAKIRADEPPKGMPGGGPDGKDGSGEAMG